MHYNCLIVDDEVDLAKVTCEYFQMFDVSATYVTNAAQCKTFLESNEADVLLLDINLEEESGFLLCKHIRETKETPILFISARQSDEDVLTALNIGGDDYVKKPYTLSILLAKVKIILKRIAPNEKQQRKTQKEDEHGKIMIDESTMRVYKEGQEIQLKAREFKLFTYLFEHRNTIVTKEELFSNVWGNEFFSDGTLNVHIRKLREKLEDNPNEPTMIKTIWGTGYILEL
jgi:two-component system response regulator RegX3